MDRTKLAFTAQRMTEARAFLVKENPFFGHLAMGLKLACAPCGTACTDGTHLVFDPAFAEKLSDREMQFVILHEVLHCALEHCIRGKGLHTAVYNIACDIVVNSTILYMWGLDTFQVADEIPMHLTPGGQEGRLFSSEEVYQMLLAENKLGNEEGLAGVPGVDRHDLWQGIEDVNRLSDVWKGRIMQAEKACGDTTGMKQEVRELAERLTKGAKVDWKQLLHDFIQYDDYDYTFLPPDRRFTECDFFLPAYHENEEEGSANDIWVCVDTSASIEDETLMEAMSEIEDAVRQAGLKGKLSFFDSNLTEPIPFTSAEEVRKLRPVGGGGTSFHVIFRYLKKHLYPELPKAILIFTDGYAGWPSEEMAMEVPILWLISKGGNQDVPWGQTAAL